MATATRQPESPLKYRRLAEELRQQITDGDLGPGDRLPSHAELRARYGVTQPTVERAYALLEQDGLIDRFERRGVFVRGTHRASSPGAPIAMADSRTIVAIARPDQSFFDRCVELLFRHAEIADLTLLCRPVDPAVNESLTPPSTQSKPLGFLLFRWDLAPLAKALQEAGNRVVLVGAPPADVTPEVPCVQGDHEQGGYLAVRHLLALGHRRICFHGEPSALRSLRWRGYQRAVREAQRAFPEIHMTTLFAEEIAVWAEEPERAAAYFRQSDAPTGLVVWNDHEAAKLLAVLNRAGVKIPDEVSLVGYDALPEGELVYPSLTTVDSAIGQQLQRALSLLTRPVPPPSSHTVVVTPTLICRESSAAPKKA